MRVYIKVKSFTLKVCKLWSAVGVNVRQEVKLSYAMADAASLNRPASNQLRCSVWFQSEPQVESSGLSQADLSRVNASRFYLHCCDFKKQEEHALSGVGVSSSDRRVCSERGPPQSQKRGRHCAGCWDPGIPGTECKDEVTHLAFFFFFFFFFWGRAAGAASTVSERESQL